MSVDIHVRLGQCCGMSEKIRIFLARYFGLLQSLLFVSEITREKKGSNRPRIQSPAATGGVCCLHTLIVLRTMFTTCRCSGSGIHCKFVTVQRVCLPVRMHCIHAITAEDCW